MNNMDASQTCSFCNETFITAEALTLHLISHWVQNRLEDKMEAPKDINVCREQKEKSSFQQDMSKTISAVSQDEVIDLTDEVKSMDHSALGHFHSGVAKTTKGTEEHLEYHGIVAERTQLVSSTGFNGHCAHTIHLTGRDNEMSDGSDDSDSEVYKCRICGNSFNEISNLLEHTLAHSEHSGIISDKGDSENINHSENIQNDKGPSTSSGEHNPRTEVIKANEKPKGNSGNVNENCNRQHTDEANGVIVHSNVSSNNFLEVIDLTDEVPSQSSVQSSPITDASKDMGENSLEHLQNCVKGIEGCQLRLPTHDASNHYLNNNLDNDQVMENRISVNVEDRPYTCKTCLKVFKRKADLANHMMLHNDKRPYKCVICRIGFKKEGHLKLHMVKHGYYHKMPVFGKGTPVFRTRSAPHFQQNTYKCKTCEKCFTTIASLHYHNKKHIKQSLGQVVTNHRTVGAQHKPYKCSTCGRTFKTIKILLYHAKRAHNEERPHKCQKCERAFKTKHHLEKHMYTHKNREPQPYRSILPAQSSTVDNYQQQVIQLSTLDNYQQQVTQPSMVVEYQQQVPQPYTVDEYQQQVIQFTSVLNTLHDARHIETGTPTSTSTANYNDVPITEPTLLPTQTSENGTECENGGKHSTSETLSENVHANGDMNHKNNCEGDGIPLPQMPDHMKAENYKCSVCEKECNSEVDLHAHMTRHLTKLFKCDVCDMAFKTQFMLTIHESSHREGLPYRCSQCGRGFKWESSLDAHMVEHPKSNPPPTSNPRPFQCKICYIRFKSSLTLQKHNMVHNEDRHFKCIICGRCFKTEDDRSLHISRHRVTLDLGQYECIVCGKHLRSTGSLHNHMKMHNEEKPFTCAICGKGFKIKVGFQLHMAKYHEGDDELDIDTSETSKETAVVTGPPPNENIANNDSYEADEISTSQFSKPGVPIKSRSDIKVLKETNEQADHKALPYNCSQCGQGFEWVISLDVHITTAHRGLRSSSDLGLYGCKVCGKCFKSYGSLYSHRKVHTEDRQFKCAICGEGFKSNNNCRQHMVTHTATISP